MFPMGLLRIHLHLQRFVLRDKIVAPSHSRDQSIRIAAFRNPFARVRAKSALESLVRSWSSGSGICHYHHGTNQMETDAEEGQFQALGLSLEQKAFRPRVNLRCKRQHCTAEQETGLGAMYAYAGIIAPAGRNVVALVGAVGVVAYTTLDRGYLRRIGQRCSQKARSLRLR